MRQFIKFLKEEPEQTDDALKNPSLMHNDYNEALNAAKKMAQGQTNAQDRAYILSYKYYQQEHVKQYVVIYNKTLLSQAPDWEAKGYTIVGWVSNQDGVVTRTKDGKYVKDQGNGQAGLCNECCLSRHFRFILKDTQLSLEC